MLKIVIIISLLFVCSLAYAQPLYTEGAAYQIEVLEDGQMQIRKATIVYKDGVEISKTYHRHVLAPDTSTETLNKEVQRVQDIADAVWTNEVIENYNTKKAEREKELMQKNRN